MDKSCIRCGTCCRKGGPALHGDDLELFSGKILTKADVLTIRAGEPVYENVLGRLVLAKDELIKIKGQGTLWTCRFLQREGCSIYLNRPMECQLLMCWDQKPLQEYYQRNRLQRQELLVQGSALAELVEYHETKFSWEYWWPILCRAVLEDDQESSQAMVRMGHDEKAFRESLTARVPESRSILEFLFGRGILFLLQTWGAQVVTKDSRVHLLSSDDFKATVRSLAANSSKT